MYLERNPFIGIVSGVGSAATSMLNLLEPLLQTLALVLGIIVAWATLMAQIERKRLDKLRQIQIRGELTPSGKGTLNITAHTEPDKENDEDA